MPQSKQEETQINKKYPRPKTNDIKQILCKNPL